MSSSLKSTTASPDVYVLATQNSSGIDPGPLWGSRAQLGGAILELSDLEGKNKNGIWDDESDPVGSVAALDNQSVAPKTTEELQALARDTVGNGVTSSIRRLQEFKKRQEQHWGRRVTDLPPSAIKDGHLFAAQKAIDLVRMGRTPSDVQDFVIPAEGSVAGRTVAPRKIFCQRFKPIGKPTGRVVVVSPGYQTSGRFFYDQILTLNKRGDDVVVMDHLWAGRTGDQPGAVDSGFSIVRDIATVVDFAQREILAKEYGGGRTVVFGTSMGGGGAAAFYVALALGLIQIPNDGELWPLPIRGPIDLVLQAPYFGPTVSPARWTSLFPSFIRDKQRVRRTSQSEDRVFVQRVSQLSTKEEIFYRISALTDALKDFDAIFERLRTADADLKLGSVRIVMSDGDGLASSKRAGEWLQELKKRGVDTQLRLLPGKIHAMEMHRGYQKYATDELQSLWETQQKNVETNVVASMRKAG